VVSATTYINAISYKTPIENTSMPNLTDKPRL